MKNPPAKNERMMHVKDVAISLGVTDRTIRRYVDKLFPGLMAIGVVTHLNEEKVTLIKLDLEKNKHLDTSVQLPKTDLEKKLLVQQAMNILNEEVEELKLKLSEAQPKIDFHDKLIKSDGLYSMGEAAKILGTGRTRFFEQLREDKIFFGREPYQSFIERGYFDVKTTTKNDHIQKQAFITPTGLSWIKKKFYSDGYQTNF